MSSRSQKESQIKWPKPEKGKKPEKIQTEGSPGGPNTPGAKGTYPKKKSKGY